MQYITSIRAAGWMAAAATKILCVFLCVMALCAAQVGVLWVLELDITRRVLQRELCTRHNEPGQ